MKICVGSTNQVKIEAVRETIRSYPLLKDAVVTGVPTDSKISDQPFSVDETITGAKNRAEAAFHDCDYSIGIESGFMKIPHTKTGYLEMTVAVVYDGTRFHIGFGPCFECPPKVMEIMRTENVNLSDACWKAGLSKDNSIGSDIGIIGILTKRRKTRKDYTQDALTMALIALENKELYEPSD